MITHEWKKEPGPRVDGSTELDTSKVQAPCIVARPDGGYRLFYTAVGPARPFPACQGYLLSAVSDDGIQFTKEPGIRFSPDPTIPHNSRRVLAPSIIPLADGRWRMYFESRGTADLPTVVCSAVSSDQLNWELEAGIRLTRPNSRLAGPRYLMLPDGTGRLFCCDRPMNGAGPSGVISAVTSDGLNFEAEPGMRWQSRSHDFDSAGITAAEVTAPSGTGDCWSMVFSAWQDAPADAEVPLHPAHDVHESEDFAAASIATDMSGYRSRIFVAYSEDGMSFEEARLCIEGSGYGGPGVDAVHAEDMSLIELEPGRYRMYYACCDANGRWCVTSAVSC